MNYLEKAFSEINDEDREFVQLSMDLASQIDKYIKEKKITRRKFAEELGKEESEISKWLCGTHNFTVRTLSKIQAYFGKKLFTIENDIRPNIQSYIIYQHQSSDFSNAKTFDWSDIKDPFQLYLKCDSVKDSVGEYNFNG